MEHFSLFGVGIIKTAYFDNSFFLVNSPKNFTFLSTFQLDSHNLYQTLEISTRHTQTLPDSHCLYQTHIASIRLMQPLPDSRNLYQFQKPSQVSQSPPDSWNLYQTNTTSKGLTQPLPDSGKLYQTHATSTRCM